ncbi:MAG: hypothetical protein LBS19_07080 [Clostridiales bacterium]|jgi:hypothetical protein|nr:hypothetical protein [Clostridiales bacterium]
MGSEDKEKLDDRERKSEPKTLSEKLESEDKEKVHTGKKKSRFNEFIAKFNSSQIVIFIISLLGIVSFILMFVFQFALKSPKRFQYDIKTESIIGDQESLSEDILIYYKGVEIPYLLSTSINIKYTGTDAITGEDIATLDPLSIHYAETEGIYDIKLVNVSNDLSNIVLEWNEQSQIVYLDFEFFQKNDSFTVQILNSSKVEPILTGTIKGRKGESIQKSKFEPFPLTIVSIYLLEIIILTALFIWQFKSKFRIRSIIYIDVIVILYSIGMLIYILVKYYS